MFSPLQSPYTQISYGPHQLNAERFTKKVLLREALSNAGTPTILVNNYTPRPYEQPAQSQNR
jgi:hypothetical protein